MNRTDRLLAIILELQAKGEQRAEDLAATFEVSKRTIYRDLMALDQSGVPLIAIPGRGYSLVEGYFLPPLSFTSDEALMLLLGSDFMANSLDAQYRTAAQSAGTKISAVLPEPLRAEVADVEAGLRFVVPGSDAVPTLLPQIRRALLQRRQIKFAYHARFSTKSAKPRGTPFDEPSGGELGEATERIIDPYALVHVSGAWHLVGYCHLRRDVRTFRLSRIADLSILDKTFHRPSNFKLQQRDQSDRTLTVRALFDQETARWVEESPSFFQVAAESCPDGRLVTLRVRSIDEIVQWLLSWGAHVRVLEPDSLRQRLLHEAQAVVDAYTSRGEI